LFVFGADLIGMIRGKLVGDCRNQLECLSRFGKFRRCLLGVLGVCRVVGMFERAVDDWRRLVGDE
jgi:hypothetical protein